MEGTSETVHSRARSRRGRRRRRTNRGWHIPYQTPEQIDLDDVEPVSAEEDTDFAEEELTLPELLPDILPSWAPLDVGQDLIAEWEASAEARASRPALVATVLRSSADDTAITSIEKPAIRSAS